MNAYFLLPVPFPIGLNQLRRLSRGPQLGRVLRKFDISFKTTLFSLMFLRTKYLQK